MKEVDGKITYVTSHTNMEKYRKKLTTSSETMHIKKTISKGKAEKFGITDHIW